MSIKYVNGAWVTDDEEEKKKQEGGQEEVQQNWSVVNDKITYTGKESDIKREIDPKYKQQVETQEAPEPVQQKQNTSFVSKIANLWNKVIKSDNKTENLPEAEKKIVQDKNVRLTQSITGDDIKNASVLGYEIQKQRIREDKQHYLELLDKYKTVKANQRAYKSRRLDDGTIIYYREGEDGTEIPAMEIEEIREMLAWGEGGASAEDVRKVPLATVLNRVSEKQIQENIAQLDIYERNIAEITGQQEINRGAFVLMADQIKSGEWKPTFSDMEDAQEEGLYASAKKKLESDIPYEELSMGERMAYNAKMSEALEGSIDRGVFPEGIGSLTPSLRQMAERGIFIALTGGAGAIPVVGDLAQSLTLGVGRTLTDYTEMTNAKYDMYVTEQGIGFVRTGEAMGEGEAVIRAIGGQTLQNFIENSFMKIVGKGLNVAGKGIMKTKVAQGAVDSVTSSKLVNSSFGKAVTKSMELLKTNPAIKKVTDTVGFDGFAGEMMEEALQDVSDHVIKGEDLHITDPDWWKSTGVSIGILSSLGIGASAGANVVSTIKQRKLVDYLNKNKELAGLNENEELTYDGKLVDVKTKEVIRDFVQEQKEAQQQVADVTQEVAQETIEEEAPINNTPDILKQDILQREQEIINEGTANLTKEEIAGLQKTLQDVQVALDLGAKKRVVSQKEDGEYNVTVEGTVIPEFIPEELRSRATVQKAIDAFNNDTVPQEGTKAWQVYQAILEQGRWEAGNVGDVVEETRQETKAEKPTKIEKKNTSRTIDDIDKDIDSTWNVLHELNEVRAGYSYLISDKDAEAMYEKYGDGKAKTIEEKKDAVEKYYSNLSKQARDLSREKDEAEYNSPVPQIDEEILKGKSLAKQDILKRASNVYRRVLDEKSLKENIDDMIWTLQRREQIENPERFGSVQEFENDKGIKVGDTVRDLKENEIGYVVSVYKSTYPYNKDKIIVSYATPRHYGGSANIEDIEKVGDNETQKENEAKPKTQKEIVKETVKEKAKSIKEIAKETGIKEPNIRRILGVGAKEGTFERVAEGVYTLSKNGKQVAYIETGNAVESLPRLAKEGFKADMVFLDIPYKTPAITGGNRGMKYEFITPDEFGTVLDAVNEILVSPDSAVIYMFSQAKSGLKEMQKYTDMLDKKGLKAIARGEWQKRFKNGKLVTNVRGDIAEPEGIILLSQSGKLSREDAPIDLKFDLVRPKGYQSEKNAEMIRKMIEMTTKEGDTVLDPFAGSGVVPAEAVASGRRAVAIEKDSAVVEEVIKPRVESSYNSDIWGDDLPFRVAPDGVERIDTSKITDPKIIKLKERLEELSMRMFGDKNVEIVEQIFDAMGNDVSDKAWGKYKDSWIQILNGEVGNMEDTFYHEAVHKALKTFFTGKERDAILNQVRKIYGDDFLMKRWSRISPEEKMRIIEASVFHGTNVTGIRGLKVRFSTRGEGRTSEGYGIYVTESPEYAERHSRLVQDMKGGDRAVYAGDLDINPSMMLRWDTNSDMKFQSQERWGVDRETDKRWVQEYQKDIIAYGLLNRWVEQQKKGGMDFRVKENKALMTKTKEAIDNSLAQAIDGKQIYDYVSRTFGGNDAKASRFLAEYGFDGVMHYNTGYGEWNYTLFKNNKIQNFEAILEEQEKFRNGNVDQSIMAMAEEQLAEDILRYIDGTLPSIKGKSELRKLIEYVIDRIKQFFTNETTINLFYKDLLSGELLKDNYNTNANELERYSKIFSQYRTVPLGENARQKLLKRAKEFDDVSRFIEDVSDFRDAHTAPTRDDTPIEERVEEGGDMSLEEYANGYSNVPDDYFDPYVGARYYNYNNKEGMESFTAIDNIFRAVRAGKKNLTITVYRAVPNSIELNELIDGDWITFSKSYAVMHGESRFGEGEYKIIEQEVDIKNVWWDANDINEWGFDTGNTEWFNRLELTKIWNEAHEKFRAIPDAEASQKESLPEIVPVKLPELLAIAKDLMGKDVELTNRLRTALGVFKHMKGGTVADSKIKLHRILFEPKKEMLLDAITGREVEVVVETEEERAERMELIEKVLAHEIGHLADYYGGANADQQTMSRGNILGRIANLMRYTEGKFMDLENKVVRKELKAVTQAWNPFDDKANEKYTKYRYSSKELYAEAISMLLNKPEMLKQLAPNFYQGFIDYIARKPQVKAEFFAIWDSINEGRYLQDRADRLTKGFEEAQQRRATIAEKEKNFKLVKGFSDIKRAFKFAFVSEFSPIIDKLKAGMKEKGIALSKVQETEQVLENLKYIGNESKRYYDEVQEQFLDKLEEAEIDIDTVGKILILERNLGDGFDFANPQGLMYDYAQETYDFVKEELGEKKWEILEDRLNWFRERNFKIVEEAHKNGLMSDDFFYNTAMVNKNTYTPFAVVEYIDRNFVTAGIIQRKGSIKDVENPLVTQLMKSTSIIEATAKNKAKATVVSDLVNYYAEDIVKAKAIRGENGMFVKWERLKNDDRNLKVIQLMADGKLVGFYVDPYIAEMFEGKSGLGWTVGRVVIYPFRMFNRIFKPLVTTLRPSFAFYSNVIRDTERTGTNLAALLAVLDDNSSVGKKLIGYRLKFLKYWIKSLKSGWRFANDELDSVTTEMIDNLAIDYRKEYEPSVNELGENETDILFDPVKGKIYGRGYRSNIADWLRNAGTHIPVIKQLIIPIYDFYIKVGATLEVNTKIAGYQTLKGYGVDQKKSAFYTRRYVGTPDYKQGGRFTEFSNEMIPFSNIAIQAIRSDMELATNPTTRSGWWMQKFLTVVLPKLLMLLGATLFKYKDDEDKEHGYYDLLSEYVKSNYLAFPIGMRDGKVVAIKIPQDETSRLLGAVVWKMGTYLQGEGMKIEQLANLSAGIVPFLTGENPLWGITNDWMDYYQGRNPYDDFRGRPAIALSKWNEGGIVRFKEMLKWTSNSVGLTWFETYDDGTQTTFEKAMNAPVLERMFEVTDYGLKEREQYLEDTGKTDKLRSRREYVGKYIADPSDENLKKFANEYVESVLGKAPEGGWTGTDSAKATTMRKDFKRAILETSGKAEYRGISKSGITNEEKIQFMDTWKSRMSSQEYADYLTQLLKSEIVSGELFGEYAESRKVDQEAVYKVVAGSVKVLSGDSMNTLVWELRKRDAMTNQTLIRLRDAGYITGDGFAKYIDINSRVYKQRYEKDGEPKTETKLFN